MTTNTIKKLGVAIASGFFFALALELIPSEFVMVVWFLYAWGLLTGFLLGRYGG